MKVPGVAVVPKTPAAGSTVPGAGQAGALGGAGSAAGFCQGAAELGGAGSGAERCQGATAGEDLDIELGGAGSAGTPNCLALAAAKAFVEPLLATAPALLAFAASSIWIRLRCHGESSGA